MAQRGGVGIRPFVRAARAVLTVATLVATALPGVPRTTAVAGSAVLRVDTAATGAHVDSTDNQRAADQGVAGGTTVDRGSTYSIAEYPLAGPTTDTSPRELIVGPDGNLWFTEMGAVGGIGKMTLAGAVTRYTLPGGAAAVAMTNGSDGNVWVMENTNGSPTRMAKISPAGTIVEYTAPFTPVSLPHALATGSDGNVWFYDGRSGQVGKVTPDGIFTTYGGPPFVTAPDITAGPDGNVWFTLAGPPERRANSIGKITPSGVITTYLLPPDQCCPAAIAAGPDGNLWFSHAAGIGRITTGGTITLYPVPDGDLPIAAMAPGPDGNVWYTSSGNVLGRVTPAGVVTDYPLPTAGSKPLGITTGPDGAIWFAESGIGRLGRLILSDPSTPAPTVTPVAAGTSTPTATSTVTRTPTATPSPTATESLLSGVLPRRLFLPTGWRRGRLTPRP